MIVPLLLYCDMAILELSESWLPRRIILNSLNYDKVEFKMCGFGSTCILTHLFWSFRILKWSFV